MFWYYARRLAVLVLIVVGVLVGARFGANFIQYKFWGIPHQHYLFDGVGLAVWHWVANFFGTTPKSDYISFFSFLAAAFSAWAAFISANLAKSGLLVNRAYLFCSIPITSYQPDSKAHALEVAVTNYGKSPAESINIMGSFRVGGKLAADADMRIYQNDHIMVIIPDVSDIVKFPIPPMVIDALAQKEEICRVSISVSYDSAGHSNYGHSMYDYTIVMDGDGEDATFDFQPYRKRPWIW